MDRRTAVGEIDHTTRIKDVGLRQWQVQMPEQAGPPAAKARTAASVPAQTLPAAVPWKAPPALPPVPQGQGQAQLPPQQWPAPVWKAPPATAPSGVAPSEGAMALPDRSGEAALQILLAEDPDDEGMQDSDL